MSFIKNEEGSALPILAYIAGLVCFGVVYWFMNGLHIDLRFVSLQGTPFTFIEFMWTAIVVVYVIFGAIWLIKQYTKKKYPYGG